MGRANKAPRFVAPRAQPALGSDPPSSSASASVIDAAPSLEPAPNVADEEPNPPAPFSFTSSAPPPACEVAFVRLAYLEPLKMTALARQGVDRNHVNSLEVLRLDTSSGLARPLLATATRESHTHTLMAKEADTKWMVANLGQAVLLEAQAHQVEKRLQSVPGSILSPQSAGDILKDTPQSGDGSEAVRSQARHHAAHALHAHALSKEGPSRYENLNALADAHLLRWTDDLHFRTHVVSKGEINETMMDSAELAEHIGTWGSHLGRTGTTWASGNPRNNPSNAGANGMATRTRSPRTPPPPTHPHRWPRLAPTPRAAHG